MEDEIKEVTIHYPRLKIYKKGKAYIFVHPEGQTEFESIDKLRKDKYWEMIFDTYTGRG